MNDQSTSTSSTPLNSTLRLALTLMGQKVELTLSGGTPRDLITVAQALIAEYGGAATGGQGDQNNQKAATREAFNVERVEVSNHAGQKRVRVFGGKWMKWGVPLYPDCPDDQAEFLGLEYGSHNVGGKAIVELVGEKPVRVIATEINF